MYKAKQRIYQSPGLLQPHQEVFIMVFELFGGVAEESWEQLRQWARDFAPVGGQRRGREVSALLQAWRMQLSLALLDGRLGAMYAAAAKLRGRALAATVAEEGGQPHQERSRAYDLCSRRSVLSEYAQRASDTRGFWRAVRAM